MKYRALIGGGIDAGESALEALHREVFEEASIRINSPRLVIVEDSGSVYGIQYIYLANYESGEIALNPSSEEYGITKLGKNIYQPIWLPLQELSNAHILPKEINEILLKYTKEGFPEEPINLKIDNSNLI